MSITEQLDDSYGRKVVEANRWAGFKENCGRIYGCGFSSMRNCCDISLSVRVGSLIVSAMGLGVIDTGCRVCVEEGC